MALRKIVVEGDPILRKKCRDVEITERTLQTLEDMVDTMRDSRGVGLAAPQIGMMRRMFVAEPDPDEEKKVYYMINPEIIETEGEQTGTEGCLSVPGFVGTVKRPLRIKMKAQTKEGEEKVYEFEGFEAVVMCHEYDHLNGVLYKDRATEMFVAQEPED